MAITLKPSPFESAMAVAPPLVDGVTPLGTTVSSARQPLWGLSYQGGVRVVQIVLEDMALVCRVGKIDLIHGENDFVTGLGGNNKVIWLTQWSQIYVPGFGWTFSGKLYDVDPRDFTIRRTVTTPSRVPSYNQPFDVGGDDHTVWVYSGEVYAGHRSVYKMSAATFTVQRRLELQQVYNLNGDRLGFWAVVADSNHPPTQQVRLVYYNANLNKEIDVLAPLWEYGIGGRQLYGVVGVGGKNPATNRDRALVCMTFQNDEGFKMHLLDASDFSVLRSTLKLRGQYELARIAS